MGEALEADSSLSMNIEGLILLPAVAEKLWVKHRVEAEEVAQVFQEAPAYRFVEKGQREAEDLYTALGRTEAGRYLIVFFIRKLSNEALIVTAREMTENEKRWYARKA